MRRFFGRKAKDEESEEAEVLPNIVEAVEKLAAEMDDAQDILGELKQACECERDEAAKHRPPPAAAPEPPPLRAGQRVIVSGLQSATEHNGKLGTVESSRYVLRPCGFARPLDGTSLSPHLTGRSETGRWVVRMDEGGSALALRCERVSTLLSAVRALSPPVCSRSAVPPAAVAVRQRS